VINNENIELFAYNHGTVNPLKSPGGLGHKKGAYVQHPQNWDGWLAISKFLQMMRLDQQVLMSNSSKYLAKLNSMKLGATFSPSDRSDIHFFRSRERSGIEEKTVPQPLNYLDTL
jgi:hypothetical protein